MFSKFYVILLFFTLIILFFIALLELVSPSVSISIMAGALTGFFEALIMFPLENIKTQQQLIEGNYNSYVGDCSENSSMLFIIRRTIREYGLVGFYHGLTPVLLGAVPTQAVRWGVFVSYCNLVNCKGNLVQVTIGGILSGVINSLITGVPIDTMKTSLIHLHFTKPSSLTANSFPPLSLPSSLSSEIEKNGANDSFGSQRFSAKSSLNIDECNVTHDSTVINSSPGATSSNSQNMTQLNHQAQFRHHRLSYGYLRQPQLLRQASNCDESSLRSSRHSISSFKGWLPTATKKILNQAIRFPVHAFILGILCSTFVNSDYKSGKYFGNNIVSVDNLRKENYKGNNIVQVATPSTALRDYNKDRKKNDVDSKIFDEGKLDKLEKFPLNSALNMKLFHKNVLNYNELERNQGELRHRDVSLRQKILVNKIKKKDMYVQNMQEDQLIIIQSGKKGRGIEDIRNINIVDRKGAESGKSEADIVFNKMIKDVNHDGKEDCLRGHLTLDFIAGVIAGFSSVLITQPIDVAKTRMQGLYGHRYRNMFHCIYVLARDKSGPFGAFSQGLWSRSLRVALGSGFTFMIFPLISAHLEAFFRY